MKNIEYAELSLKLHETALQNDIPLDGMIALTSHCNLNCRHCYIRDNSVKDELTLKEICRIIDEITDAGCLYLLLTGGEPLLREDFGDIYAYARKKGLIITLFTNGTLINEDTALLMKRYMPFSVEITLYGATPDTYESFTGVKGSYDSCINGIKLLLKHKIPLTLKTMVTTVNKHELHEIKNFAEDLGVKFRYGLSILPKINGSQSPYDVRIGTDENVSTDFCDKDRSREWSELYAKFNAPASKEFLFNCGAGRNCFSITSSGRLRICDIVPEPDHCLRNNTFIDGYRMFGSIRRKKIKGVTKCAGCEHITFCDSCPGISMLEGNKDGESPVSYHCEIAHKRAERIREETLNAKEETI